MIQQACVLHDGPDWWGGYPRVRENGYTWYAHRLAWTKANGPIPEGMLVLHSCDNPKCVNVDHLFLGTQSDNMRDMYAKGRGQKSDQSGSSNGNSKMTENQVREIRRLHATGRVTVAELARQFGLKWSGCDAIVKREHWKEVV